MSLLDTINKDLIAAMRARDHERIAPLRMLKTALVNRRIESGQVPTDAEAKKIIATLIKQRKDSIKHFTLAKRNDLAQRETVEINVLETYLPPLVDQAEIEQVVNTVIRETGSQSTKDFGQVMKIVMSEFVDSNVDGEIVSEIVRRKLNS